MGVNTYVCVHAYVHTFGGGIFVTVHCMYLQKGSELY